MPNGKFVCVVGTAQATDLFGSNNQQTSCDSWYLFKFSTKAVKKSDMSLFRVY